MIHPEKRAIFGDTLLRADEGESLPRQILRDFIYQRSSLSTLWDARIPQRSIVN